MERIAIAELNLNEVVNINKENALAALCRSGGKILFVTPQEEDDEQLDETGYDTLSIISTETGDGLCHQWFLGAEVWKGRIQLLCEDFDNHLWLWHDIAEINNYEENMVYELLINKYNENYEE